MKNFRKKIKAFTRKPYLLVFSCVCIFIILSAFRLGAFKASTSKKQVDFPVVSLVPDLVVVDVNILDNYALLLSFVKHYQNVICTTEFVDLIY